MGTGLAAAALSTNAIATAPEQLAWLGQCLVHREPQVGAFCSSEPEAGSDVSAMKTRARYDEAAKNGC